MFITSSYITQSYSKNGKNIKKEKTFYENVRGKVMYRHEKINSEGKDIKIVIIEIDNGKYKVDFYVNEKKTKIVDLNNAKTLIKFLENKKIK